MTEPADKHGFTTVTVGPLVLTNTDLDGALAKLDAMVRDGRRHYVSFCDANLLVLAHHNPEMAAMLNRSDMTLADGVILILTSRLTGSRLSRRLPGPSFMLAACEHGIALNYRHFFFGGEPGVADEMAARLTTRFPGLRVAGTYSPPFSSMTSTEEGRIRRTIEDAQADLLWVGLGGTKQVQWMAQHLHAINVPVMLGVGAAFDFHSGRVPWAPSWIRSLGMEWAFRAVTGGRRIFIRNLTCVPQSALFALRETWRARVGIRSAPAEVQPARVAIRE